MVKQVAIPKSSQEHVWQFPVADGATHVADNGARYFEIHARQLANSLGFHFLAMKNIKLKHTVRDVWTVSGTVVLGN